MEGISLSQSRELWYDRIFLTEMLILCEEIVKHPESGLQVQVDDVLRPSLGFWKPGVLHEIKR